MRARYLQFAFAAAAVLAAGCGSDEPSGHDRMLALLRDVAARTDDEHVYQGDRALRRLRADVQRLGARAPQDLLRDTGIAALQHGDEREGIELLDQALRRATTPGERVLVEFWLGVAWLRRAETDNCCAEPSADSCIVPIRGDGVHRHAEGSTNALRHFLRVLEATPDTEYWHLAALWLANLASMTLGDWPDGLPDAFRLPASAFAPESDFPRFPNVAQRLGLDTLSLAGGAVADDFDGDGWIDLVVTTWAPAGQMRYFHNERDGTFADRTAAANLTGLTGGLNVVQADYDGDGDLDLLVLRGAWLDDKGRHPNSLLQNDGRGVFTDVTFEAGLGAVHCPTQAAAFADYDNDGDLDLYVGNESKASSPFASQLFRNEGDGTFTDTALLAGVQNMGFCKGVAWGDYDGDRWPDLYVSNHKLPADGPNRAAAGEQHAPNRLYRNRGDGTFVDVAAELGVTKPDTSFPTWFWDFDNDGALDLWVGAYGTGVGHVVEHLLGRQNSGWERMALYRGDGKGGFRDVAGEVGLTAPALPMGCNFGDLDNDGWLDVYLGTGDPHYFNLVPNQMYRNEGGRRFASVTMAGGFGHLQKGHGVAFADFDNDGDLDVFEEMGGAFLGDRAHDAFYENPGFGRHWLSVLLVGTESNRSAIGARIRADFVDGGETRSVFRTVGLNSSFGGNPLRQHLGLGSAAVVERLEVWWPKTDARQVFTNVAADRTVRITEGKDAIETLPLRAVTLAGRK